MKLLFKTILPLLLLVACNSTTSSNEQMVELMQNVSKEVRAPGNPFCPEAQKAHLDSLIAVTHDPYQLFDLKNSLGMALLKLGDEQKAIALYEGLLKEARETGVMDNDKVLSQLALAYLRFGEKTNCLHNHSAESCIFPLSFAAVHQNKFG